jgi:hypothetical protein
VDRYLIKSWLKQQFVLIIALLLSAGVFWWVQSYSTLWRHIMPGISSRGSLSTKPYNVTLRVASKAGKLLDESASPMEWALRLPRTYVTREFGTKGAVYRRKIKGGDFYTVSFQTLVSEDGKTFIPTAMILKIRNREATPEIRSFDACVPDHMRKVILEARGFKSIFNGYCYERDRRCLIDMHMDGWDVDLVVSKELYATPEVTCGLARQFLQQYTVRRDDIR